jgi:hypothetical protein
MGIEAPWQRQESPVWYVEPCGGEGEYHVGRMRDVDDERQPMKWPRAEDSVVWVVFHQNHGAFTTKNGGLIWFNYQEYNGQ